MVWLGQLKVPLRPIWAPAQDILATLLTTHEGVAWYLVFRELEGCTTRRSRLTSTSQHTADDLEPDKETGKDGMVQHDNDNDEPEQEKEKTWRCPNAEKRRALVRRWTVPATRVLNRQLQEVSLYFTSVAVSIPTDFHSFMP